MFLKGTTDNPASTTSEGQNTDSITIKRASEVEESEEGNVYIVHPAFTNESGNGYANGGWDREIPGFWMAKFEAGYVGEPNNLGDQAKDSPVTYSTLRSWTDTADVPSVTTVYSGERTEGVTPIDWPTFQPLRPSFNYIGIGDAYELCKKIDGSDPQSGVENPYQLKNVDSHLTKNSEWGAVAYLSYSAYGLGNTTEVAINNANAGGSEGGIWAVTGYGSAMDGVTSNLSKLLDGSTAGGWDSMEGKKASTNGNISGVYDMSGGLWEWTAGFVDTDNTSLNVYGRKLREEVEGKYTNIYENAGSFSNSSHVNNYGNPRNSRRKGEGIWETSTQSNNHSGWNDDYSFFMYHGENISMRGGKWSGETSAGVFAFNRSGGFCSWDIGFRPVLVCE